LVSCAAPADSPPPSEPSSDAGSQAPEADDTDTGSPPQDQPDDTDNKYVIGVSMATLGSSYGEACKTGLDNTAAELGNVELSYLVAGDDANMQNQQIATFISQGVDAIICVPYDTVAILTAIEECNAAGIPFIFCDRPIEGTANAAPDYGVATDNYALTRLGAQWLVDRAKAAGEVIYAVEFMGALSDEGAVLRSNAYNDVAEANPDVLTIVTSVPTEWDFAVPYTALKDAYAANPEINAILGASDAFFPACANALVELGKWYKVDEEGHVPFIGVDGEPYAIRALEQGWMLASMPQPIMITAKECVLAAITLADGGSMGEDYKLLPGFVLTLENFDELGSQTYGYANKDEHDFDNLS